MNKNKQRSQIFQFWPQNQAASFVNESLFQIENFKNLLKH